MVVVGEEEVFVWVGFFDFGKVCEPIFVESFLQGQKPVRLSREPKRLLSIIELASMGCGFTPEDEAERVALEHDLCEAEVFGGEAEEEDQSDQESLPGM